MATPTRDQEELLSLNETFLEQLNTPGMEKNAVGAAEDFTRTTIREDGFYRKIMPMIQIRADQLTRQVYDDKWVKVVDKQPGSPGAVSVGFGTFPTQLYVRGPRYECGFTRIMTRKFYKDVAELATWEMDIRQVISDDSVKDMLAEEDGKWLQAVNTALFGRDVVSPLTDVVQWESIFGGVSRDTLQEALSIMEKGPSHLSPAKILANNVFMRQLMKIPMDEWGGGGSEDIFVKGWTMEKFMNCDWIVSIKRKLIPDNSIYMFGDPDFIGKSYVYEEPVMWVHREMFMVYWCTYETIGGGIGNTSALARADFV